MINEYFTTEAPSIQLALDTINTNWVSKLPIVDTVTGEIPLFDDARMHWLVDRVNLRGKTVLELGSFEGGHSYILSKTGAEITAIESNSLSYLKALVAKDILGYRAKNLYGDFLEFLPSAPKFDLIVASGVLYHMENPVKLLCEIADKTSKIFLWTHYFDSNFQDWNPEVLVRLEDKFAIDGKFSEFKSHRYPVITQSYLESLNLKEFCGGPTERSAWMYRADILKLLAELGFKTIEVIMENREHKHGPSFAVYAEK
jgi:SAM-dependent methyltransferase